MARRHSHTAASWRSANWSVCSGVTMRNQKFALVEAQREQRLLFVRLLLTDPPHILANLWVLSQHSDPLECSGQTQVLPHDCVGFLHSGDPHQLLDALWGHPEPVPHLRLALVATSTTRPGLQTTTFFSTRRMRGEISQVKSATLHERAPIH